VKPSTVLAALRRTYRKLPISMRMSIGRVIMRAAEPILARRLPLAAPENRTSARSACLLGLFNAPLGHGAAALLLHRELEAAGVATVGLDVSDALGAIREEGLASPITGTDVRACDAAIVVLNPDSMIFGLGDKAEFLRGKRVVGYWVWELETAPKRWRRALHAVHDIWSPSAFSARAVEAAVGRPVQVAPHPVALGVVAPRSEERRAARRAKFGVGPDDFLALNSFSITSSLERKNPIAAMRAFTDAFSGQPRARLIVRCMNASRYPLALKRVRDAAHEAGPQIILIDQPAGLDELHDLYAAADVYLSLHRSEGFGLNLAEAMLAGLPVIATAWSGNMDFMDDASAALVPFRLVPVRDAQGVYVDTKARWAEPDHDATVAHLRALAEDRLYRSKLGSAGAAMVRSRLGGGAAARLLSETP
jgi:glycosyltransferase involved in cell wall biosynthesis